MGHIPTRPGLDLFKDWGSGQPIVFHPRVPSQVRRLGHAAAVLPRARRYRVVAHAAWARPPSLVGDDTTMDHSADDLAAVTPTSTSRRRSRPGTHRRRRVVRYKSPADGETRVREGRLISLRAAAMVRPRLPVCSESVFALSMLSVAANRSVFYRSLAS